MFAGRLARGKTLVYFLCNQRHWRYVQFDNEIEVALRDWIKFFDGPACDEWLGFIGPRTREIKRIRRM
jgi:hypothetical protein